ncbi:MAG: cell division protein FtsA [Bacillota bacterium]
MIGQEMRRAAGPHTPDKNVIFALDIGTRSVIGIVAEAVGPKLNILAQSITEHESRAVFDGQIHDIFKVSQAVKRVKDELEKKTGFILTRVAVAAAGRSLKTCVSHVEQEIGDDIEIDQMICRGLEMDAVKEAHRRLREEAGGDGQEEYYCVGYTVVTYYLNDYPFTTLIGHFGKKIGVDVVATFLPNSVVNSMYSVLGRVNLEPVSLTLEPIAASTAVIPETYRLLNLALVDVGAGTSDIAITRDGSIVAYGMVPEAGDEVTEALAQGLLVDFNTAELKKREIAEGCNITFRDIMGFERSIDFTGAMEVLEPVLDRLTTGIVDEILRLNGNKPPKSVFCVGGGAKIPTFTGRIASKLGLPPERVGLRNRKSIADLTVCDQMISGPEGVTVVGIARVAVDSVGSNFITINVNGKDYRLFHSRELTVFDSLGLIEYNLGDLVGKNGKDLRFVLNGERKVVYGGLCKEARVTINGKPGNLKGELHDGDRVVVVKAVRGEDAVAHLNDFMDGYKTGVITVNGRTEVLRPQCIVNGKQVESQYQISDGDVIEIREIKNVALLAASKGIDLRKHEVTVNGEKASGDRPLNEGDIVEFSETGAGVSGVSGAPVESQAAAVHGLGELRNVIHVMVNNERITLTGKNSYIFVDVFRHIDIDLSGGPSRRIVLRRNGKEAGYTDPLLEGDVIEVRWE